MLGALASLSLMFVSAAVPSLGIPVEPAETHCVVFVVDQKPDGEYVLSDPTCFAEEARADALAGVGYPLTLPPLWMVAGTATTSAFSSFTLGKHYDGAGGTGSSITVAGSSCTGGYWNTPAAWDNRISSSYNGCARLRHWDLPGKAGSYEDTSGAGTTDNLSVMNNRTESVSYHSS